MSFYAGIRVMLLSAWVMASASAAFHVAPNGSDEYPGTEAQPFLTLECARDAIRLLKQQETMPVDGVEVLIHPGTYSIRHTFQLTEEDSGSPDAPITYRAATTEPPCFTGGIRLNSFSLVTEEAVLARLPESAQSFIMEARLPDALEIIPFELGGFSSGRGFTTHPAMELFVNDEPMSPARWPNEGFVKTGEVTGPLTLTGWDKRPGSPEGRFRFEGDRLSRWVDEPDAWLYGYWYWDWADSYEKIARIDLETGEIVLAEPWHRYGYRKDQRFIAVNMLSELDAPGEWYLDRVRRRVYLFPKDSLDQAVVELSCAAFPFVEMKNVSHVRFQGILWECGAADGITVQGGEDCRLEGCTLRKMAGNGVVVRNGRLHALQSCNLHTLGRGGVILDGGDRKTLAPGNHAVENCHIHHTSRIDHTYTPGVLLNGVGNRVRHNKFHDIASSALRVGGNDHLIELNEIYRVVTESDDQGGADMWGDPTFRGNVYRYNYWHHLGNPSPETEEARSMQAGIRLDDAICDVLIYGNVFHRCSTAPTRFGGVQIHGGKDNRVEKNLFVDCAAAVSFTPWGEKRWHEFVKDALDAPAIDRELYVQRYPLLAQLLETHDVNIIRDNTVVRCAELFLRAPEGLQTSDNHEYPEDKAFQEGTDGRLLWAPEEADRLGVAAIPFNDIGLYQDDWRKMTQ